jgi:F0F1-type ATP synthase assembly protein I
VTDPATDSSTKEQPPAPGGQPDRKGARRTPPTGENSGYTILSYLIAGMVAYGGIGWLAAHWTGFSLAFPLGMLFGLAVSIGLVIHRYGRS